LHLSVDLGYDDTRPGLSSAAIVYECLHSANFWEQESIRCELTPWRGFSLLIILLNREASFFAVQHSRTSFLNTVDVTNPSPRKRVSTESQIWDAVKTYTFLLYAPAECFPKILRNDFLKRAVVLDFLLGSDTSPVTGGALQVVRTFLSKGFNFLGSWEHEASGRYLHYLMTSPLQASAEQVTRELVHGHLL
jgi:hypothetical protein